MKNCTTYTVIAPATPGATPTIRATVPSLGKARTAAREYASRRDLTYQDVRIERNGAHREYAGPTR